MAEQLPNIYTLGQVKVDTSSLADLQGKLLAQKQAKEEALNKYFEKQMGTLSSEGIAKNDMADYEKSISDLKNYWKQNAQAIKKGGQSKADFDNKVQEIKNFVGESKDKKSQTLKYREQYQFGNKTPTDTDIDVLGYIELPLKDPKRINPKTGNPYGLTDLSVQIPPFTSAKKQSWLSNISKDIQPVEGKPTKTVDKTSGKEIFTYPLSYDDKKIKFMADNAAASLRADREALNYYEQLKNEPTSPEFIELKNVWDASKMFVGDMDTPEELAKAEILREFKIKPRTRTQISDIPKATGGSGGGGPKDKWEDYYFLDKYTPVPIGNTGKQGIEATNVGAAQRKVLDNLKIIPFYDVQSGKDYYIYDKPGQWRGEDGQVVTNDDVAEATAPQELKRTRKAEGGKKVVKY